MRFSETLVHNGSPYEEQGPAKPEWSKLIGDYGIWQWGKLAQTINLHISNGHLYFGKHKVVEEYEPALFFLADGEALDLRGETPAYRNIKLIRR